MLLVSKLVDLVRSIDAYLPFHLYLKDISQSNACDVIAETHNHLCSHSTIEERKGVD